MYRYILYFIFMQVNVEQNETACISYFYAKKLAISYAKGLTLIL